MRLNVDQLNEFAKKGQAAQAAVDAIINSTRKCAYCGTIFLPQSWNHKFCDYACRYLRREKLKQER